MRKRPYILLISTTIIFISFILGFLTGRITDKNHAFNNSTDGISDETPQETTTQNFKININTADIEQLVLLDGIGESIAKNIIAYREEFGPFSTTKDLLKVKGIGEKKFQEIADYITTGG